MMKMKPKLGVIYNVINGSPRQGANKQYQYVRVRDQLGYERRLLFTDRQIEDAENRAEKNPEDLVKKVSFRDWIRSGRSRSGKLK